MTQGLVATAGSGTMLGVALVTRVRRWEKGVVWLVLNRPGRVVCGRAKEERRVGPVGASGSLGRGALGHVTSRICRWAGPRIKSHPFMPTLWSKVAAKYGDGRVSAGLLWVKCRGARILHAGQRAVTGQSEVAPAGERTAGFEGSVEVAGPR
jgi:hypothetical protein